MHSISGPSNRLRGEALWLGYAEKDIEEGAILGLFLSVNGNKDDLSSYVCTEYVHILSCYNSVDVCVVLCISVWNSMTFLVAKSDLILLWPFRPSVCPALIFSSLSFKRFMKSNEQCKILKKSILDPPVVHLEVGKAINVDDLEVLNILRADMFKISI